MLIETTTALFRDKSIVGAVSGTNVASDTIDFRTGGKKYLNGDSGAEVFRAQHFRVDVWVKRAAASEGSATLSVVLSSAGAADGTFKAFHTSPVTALADLVEGRKLVDSVVIPESAGPFIKAELVNSSTAAFTAGTVYGTITPAEI